MRRLRTTAVVVGVAAALMVGALLTSEWLGWPSRSIESEIEIYASPELVWQTLADFPSYEEWNPLFTEGEGEPRVGENLRLRLETPGMTPISITPEVLIVKTGRKVFWQERTLLPGVSDREYEFIVEPIDSDRVRVLQEERFEGLFSPLVSAEQEELGLDLLGEALKKRAEEAMPGTTIETSDPWLCTRSLETYGELPIILRSRIDNAAVQPLPVEAVTLSRGCTGDGDPDTIDLVVEVEGDGEAVGPTSDAIRVKLGAHDIVVSGSVDCGAPVEGVSQNGVFILSGDRITFRDLHIGDTSSSRPTCRGDGGAFAVQQNLPSPPPQDIVCIRCEIAGVNRALYIGDSTRSGARDSELVSESKPYVADGANSSVTEGNTWRPLALPEKP